MSLQIARQQSRPPPPAAGSAAASRTRTRVTRAAGRPAALAGLDIMQPLVADVGIAVTKFAACVVLGCAHCRLPRSCVREDATISPAVSPHGKHWVSRGVQPQWSLVWPVRGRPSPRMPLAGSGSGLAGDARDRDPAGRNQADSRLIHSCRTPQSRAAPANYGYGPTEAVRDRAQQPQHDGRSAALRAGSSAGIVSNRSPGSHTGRVRSSSPRSNPFHGLDGIEDTRARHDAPSPRPVRPRAMPEPRRQGTPPSDTRGRTFLPLVRAGNADPDTRSACRTDDARASGEFRADHGGVSEFNPRKAAGSTRGSRLVTRNTCWRCMMASLAWAPAAKAGLRSRSGRRLDTSGLQQCVAASGLRRRPPNWTSAARHLCRRVPRLPGRRRIAHSTAWSLPVAANRPRTFMTASPSPAGRTGPAGCQNCAIGLDLAF